MPEGTRTKKAAGSSRGDMMDASRGVGGMYVKVVPPPDVNKNTSWFQYPGVWTTYILIIFISWLLILSVFGCDAGTAWTVVNLAHFAVTYRFFHWKKGTPFAEDQGDYAKLTWWEQMDNGRQNTRNRKFLIVVPVVLYVLLSLSLFLIRVHGYPSFLLFLCASFLLPS
jgi:hypothetical protein